MIQKLFNSIFLLIFFVSFSCQNQGVDTGHTEISKRYNSGDTVRPITITDTVTYDTDDPAIYIDAQNIQESFVIGTDKDSIGALVAFDLSGKIIEQKSFKPLVRPNNCDINYGLNFNGEKVDIALVAERLTHKVRVIQLPDVKAIDNGGIEAFLEETLKEGRDLMGISSYKAENGDIYAIVGRKTGPTDGTYLQQFKLVEDSGYVKGELVREFGLFSGLNEIEAIAVDQENGFIYYCDEGVGIRKYHANPTQGNEELSLFGGEIFTEDNEGIAIYKTNKKEGYIFVSDQGIKKLQVFDRLTNQHLGEINYSALETDGIEVVNNDLGGKFPGGLLVAMSTDKTFHYYSVKELLEALVPSK